MNKWQGDDATFLKGLDMLAPKLTKLRDRLKASASKKRGKLAAKLGDYQTEHDIQDAYGYAEITETERVALLQLLQENKEALYPEDAAVFYLNAIIHDLRLDRDDWIEDIERKKRQAAEAAKRNAWKGV